MIHAHVTSWTIALILFFVTYFLLKSGKMKGHKITSMALRLFYVLIIITGGMVFVQGYINSGYYPVSIFIKLLVGIWVIGSMEMVLAKSKRGDSATGMWIMFAISLILVLFLGYGILG